MCGRSPQPATSTPTAVRGHFGYRLHCCNRGNRRLAQQQKYIAQDSKAKPFWKKPSSTSLALAWPVSDSVYSLWTILLRSVGAWGSLVGGRPRIVVSHQAAQVQRRAARCELEEITTGSVRRTVPGEAWQCLRER